MSESYCNTCDHFRPGPFTYIGGWGHCSDPAKIIYGGEGSRVNKETPVRETFNCIRHTGLVGRKEQTDD